MRRPCAARQRCASAAIVVAPARRTSVALSRLLASARVRSRWRERSIPVVLSRSAGFSAASGPSRHRTPGSRLPRFERLRASKLLAEARVEAHRLMRAQASLARCSPGCPRSGASSGTAGCLARRAVARQTARARGPCERPRGGQAASRAPIRSVAYRCTARTPRAAGARGWSDLLHRHEAETRRGLLTYPAPSLGQPGAWSLVDECMRKIGFAIIGALATHGAKGRRSWAVLLRDSAPIVNWPCFKAAVVGDNAWGAHRWGESIDGGSRPMANAAGPGSEMQQGLGAPRDAPPGRHTVPEESSDRIPDRAKWGRGQ